jgi:hypothetical protein
MEPKTVVSQCPVCDAREFKLRIDVDEQVGLLTCSAGHHSLLLDSREYWTDVIQEGRPKGIKCSCGEVLFRVELTYDFRDNGDVRYVDVVPSCYRCGRTRRGASFEINDSPTIELVSKPLDPIEHPWLRGKQVQITAYWQPADAERFAKYLSGIPDVRVYRQSDGLEQCGIGDVEFYPQLKHDLYFTNSSIVPSLRIRDPQKVTALLRLCTPLPMACPGGVALLHYIEYNEQILRGMEILNQPESFLVFTRQARSWLKQNYLSKRGKNTVDNPMEYERIASLLRRLS